eukprot:218413_1
MSETETPSCNAENETESKFIGVVIRIENGPSILFADFNALQSNRLQNCDLYFNDFVVEGNTAISKIASIEKNYYLLHAKYIKNAKQSPHTITKMSYLLKEYIETIYLCQVEVSQIIDLLKEIQKKHMVLNYHSNSSFMSKSNY